MQSYKKVKPMLMADTLTTTTPEMTSRSAAKEFTKKKRKSMMELKKYTGSPSKKTKRDSNKFKGWSKEGKAFMVKMMKAIKDDVESRAYGKWEKLYKKICDAINKSDQIDQGSSSSGDEMDYSVLYAKV
jgi:uracil DNA glycosylase